MQNATFTNAPSRRMSCTSSLSREHPRPSIAFTPLCSADCGVSKLWLTLSSAVQWCPVKRTVLITPFIRQITFSFWFKKIDISVTWHVLFHLKVKYCRVIVTFQHNKWKHIMLNHLPGRVLQELLCYVAKPFIILRWIYFFVRGARVLFLGGKLLCREFWGVFTVLSDDFFLLHLWYCNRIRNIWKSSLDR